MAEYQVQVIGTVVTVKRKLYCYYIILEIYNGSREEWVFHPEIWEKGPKRSVFPGQVVVCKGNGPETPAVTLKGRAIRSKRYRASQPISLTHNTRVADDAILRDDVCTANPSPTVDFFNIVHSPYAKAIYQTERFELGRSNSFRNYQPISEKDPMHVLTAGGENELSHEALVSFFVQQSSSDDQENEQWDNSEGMSSVRPSWALPIASERNTTKKGLSDSLLHCSRPSWALPEPTQIPSAISRRATSQVTKPNNTPENQVFSSLHTTSLLSCNNSSRDPSLYGAELQKSFSLDDTVNRTRSLTECNLSRQLSKITRPSNSIISQAPSDNKETIENTSAPLGSITCPKRSKSIETTTVKVSIIEVLEHPLKRISFLPSESDWPLECFKLLTVQNALSHISPEVVFLGISELIDDGEIMILDTDQGLYARVTYHEFLAPALLLVLHSSAEEGLTMEQWVDSSMEKYLNRFNVPKEKLQRCISRLIETRYAKQLETGMYSPVTGI